MATVVEEHGCLGSFYSVLTMCYCFVYTIHCKFVCNTMQVCKHISVNLHVVIPGHMYSLRSARCAISHDPH